MRQMTFSFLFDQLQNLLLDSFIFQNSFLTKKEEMKKKKEKKRGKKKKRFLNNESIIKTKI